MEELNIGLYTKISASGLKYLYGNYNLLNLIKIHVSVFSNAEYKKKQKNPRIPDMRMIVRLEKVGANKKESQIESLMEEVFNTPNFEEEEIPFEETKEKATAE